MNHFSANQIHEADYKTIGCDAKNALPHHDNSIEIIQFWSEGGYFVVRNNVFPITPCSIVVVNVMETHYSNPSNIQKYNRSKLIISSDCFRHICELCGFSALYETIFRQGGIQVALSPSQSQTALADGLFKEAAECFRQLVPELDAQAGYFRQPSKTSGLQTAQASIIDAVIRLLMLVLQASEENQAPEVSEHTLHLLTDYINSRLSSWEEINLKDICDTLHISPSYASHLFKRLMNKSITQYVTELRIAEAKKLLLSTDLSVAAIAEMLKFPDSTSFCRMFKKYTGCTPRGYRVGDGMIG